MTPEEWVNFARRCIKARNFEPLNPADHQISQGFASALDHAGLEKFAEKSLRLCLNDQQYERIAVKDISAFENQLRKAIELAPALIDPQFYKALYFEYFYDGAEDCEGLVFSCRDYSDHEDSWICSYTHARVVRGPKISRFLAFGPYLEFKAVPYYIANSYIHKLFLAAAIRVWRVEGKHLFPLGFARHDGPVIRIRSEA